jgi:hypothetical protein
MYNEKYWEEKKAKKELKEGNPDRKKAIQRIKEMLIGFFTPRGEEEAKHDNHTRTYKERRMRRVRHQSMMRNAT